MALSLLTMLLLVSSISVAIGARYNIGDTKSRTASDTVDYAMLASGKNFQVGDVLDFKYNDGCHNMMKVNSEDFESCNLSSPISTYTNTTGQDSIELTSTGHHYFVCGVPGHCDAGQKVHIVVRACGTPGITVTRSSASSLAAAFKWFGAKLVILSLIYCCIVS